MADPAFGLAADDHDKAVNLLKEYGYIEGEAHLGITVISRMGHSLNQEEVSRYYTNLAGSLSSFISQHHIHVFFFGQVIGPTEIEDDRKANEIIRKRLSAEPSQVSIVDTQMTPSMLKACYGLMDLFVASRLHSGIFAISMGIPTVFIGYLHKTRGLLQALGLENWVIDLREQDDGLIRSKLESAWAERKQLSTMLFSMMPDIIKMTQEIPELIRVDYEKYLCKG
jgi:colanic acid/amylovoran biosynthesis protein